MEGAQITYNHEEEDMGRNVLKIYIALDTK
jgi:hypothetical protein